MEGVGYTNQAPANLLIQSDAQLYHSPSVRSALPPDQWNPLKPAGAGSDKFGPELAFAFKMQHYFPDKKIALIKHARGGTKLTTEQLNYETTSWHPGNNNSDTLAFGKEYRTFVRCVTNALALLEQRGDSAELAGMLWVQGEADSTSVTAGAAYAANFARFANRVREQFNKPTLPIVCARILPYQTRLGSASVRAALTDADQNSGKPGAIPGVYTVFTEGLGVHTDNVHFNTPGQTGLGTLLADTMYQRALPTLPELEPPSTIACWQLDENSNPPHLLDATGIYHLDLHVANTAAPPVMPIVNQAALPIFIDGSAPDHNSAGGRNPAGMRRMYDHIFDMRDKPWTFEAFFQNDAIGTQSTYQVIGGTRSSLSQYHGWRVIMINGKIRFFATANSDKTTQVISEQRYDDGKAHHLAAIWEPSVGESGTLRLYIDGVPTGEAPGLGDLGDDATYPKRFAVGANIGGTVAQPTLDTYRWIGVLDEIRFSSGALQPTKFLSALPKGTQLKISTHDSMERIFTDQLPLESKPVTIHAPRGGRAWIQFALQTSLTNGNITLKTDGICDKNKNSLKSECRIHALRKVNVEANYNGCARSRAGLKPPSSILEHVVRTAPFELYESLTDQAVIPLDNKRVYAALMRIEIDSEAKPGNYQGALRATLNGKVFTSPEFNLAVHNTRLPREKFPDVVHWFWHAPENLTDAHPPPWWSEQHWQLLAASGSTLHDFGDTIIFTPLIHSQQPLITTSINPADNLQWSFDFTRFRHWVRTFKSIGFTGFLGSHLSQHNNVFGFDPVQNKTIPLNLSSENYHNIFLPAFYRALYVCLDELDIRNCYYQNLLDEPRENNLEHYRKMAGILRNSMPNIQIAEALGRSFSEYAKVVDIPVWWFGKVYSRQWPDLIEQRYVAGHLNWIYYACTPAPPWPNTHLDTHLWRARSLPWVAHYCRSRGILHWAANAYRGANPYSASIGPLPNGSTTPGHPPGDNWLFYPTHEGLVSSMRMVAFHQGLEDFALLKLLQQKNPIQAKHISTSIIANLVLDNSNDIKQSRYADHPAAYLHARENLLKYLD